MPPFTYAATGTIQTFTATVAGTYDITAFGAQGGAGDASGGMGAEATGSFTLAAGETLEIVVGSAGASNQGAGGGGGGSFVIETANGSGVTGLHTILLIAGGGGGGGRAGSGGDGGGSGLSTAGGGSGVGNQSPGGGGSGGAGGTGGGGIYGGGGGSGVSSAGGHGGGGLGGSGGHDQTGSYAGGNSFYKGAGGFGGGGGGSYGGGGGGGYSGGGGGADGGGGGGGSIDHGASAVITAGIRTGAGGISLTRELCYLRGTHILTPDGQVFVEDLKIGGLVMTRFGGIQPIRWIGRQTYHQRGAGHDPICLHAGALGDNVPAHDLYISPGHSMLVNGQLAQAKYLLNARTITRDWAPAVIDYFQIELEAHDCVLAEGAWSETYADWPGGRAQFHNAAEFALLYPAHVPVEALCLCAPRPESGPELEAMVRPVVARAARGLAELCPVSSP